ncbi:hypothetical protein JCM19233_739 [Vibrio astriarenae]|nr:hypothetical protein JCM19233_739 [Vibrio sp. C7]
MSERESIMSIPCHYKTACKTAVNPLVAQRSNAPIRIFSFGSD